MRNAQHIIAHNASQHNKMLIRWQKEDALHQYGTCGKYVERSLYVCSPQDSYSADKSVPEALIQRNKK